MKVKAQQDYSGPKTWITVKLRRKLRDRIEDAIQAESYGVPSYDSITDFVQTACLRLLDQQQTRKKSLVAEAVS